MGLHVCQSLSDEASTSLRLVYDECVRMSRGDSIVVGAISNGEAVSQLTGQAHADNSTFIHDDLQQVYEQGVSALRSLACFKQMLSASDLGKLDLSELQRRVINGFLGVAACHDASLERYHAELPSDEALAMTQVLAMEVVWRSQPHEPLQPPALHILPSLPTRQLHRPPPSTKSRERHPAREDVLFKQRRESHHLQQIEPGDESPLPVVHGALFSDSGGGSPGCSQVQDHSDRSYGGRPDDNSRPITRIASEQLCHCHAVIRACVSHLDSAFVDLNSFVHSALHV